MDPIFDSIITFFQNDGWQIETDLDNLRLITDFRGPHGQWRCFAQYRFSPAQFVFYSLCPIAAPSDRRQVMANFLTRANYNMIVGNFEMDFEDGEIRYKTSLNFEGSQLDDALLKQLAYINVVMMNKYLPGIEAVAEGKTAPQDAISLIEGP